MNGKEVMTDLVGRGVICSYIKNMPSFLKKMVMFLRNEKDFDVFLKYQGLSATCIVI